ncbi:MAG: Tm-1-like ATP-binding domain-containing protein [Chloroflexi bacterium]|nr:Tm-1-like ATP-binding domain-containing protein [Chloroflexota bacterium]
MHNKTIVIVANLDTRGEDFKLVRELIEERGHRAVFLDFSMEGVPFYQGDITEKAG